MKSFGDGSRLVVRLDRALVQGEYRGKLYLLTTDNIVEVSVTNRIFMMIWCNS